VQAQVKPRKSATYQSGINIQARYEDATVNFFNDQMFLEFETDVEPIISDLKEKWQGRKSEIASESRDVKSQMVSLDIEMK
jgi:hypothetical protein